MSDSEGGYISISPDRLALLCLRSAVEEIDRTGREPERWFFALPLLLRSLNSALVAALSGSAGIGAYDEKDRKAWLKWFDDSRINDVPAPDKNRVQSVRDLLKRASDATDAYVQGAPLCLSQQEYADLETLIGFRDDLEHVKPLTWVLQSAGLPRIARSTAAALRQLFQTQFVTLHLEDDEVSDLEEYLHRLANTQEGI
ncbi:hypothetical protein [Chelatococcus sp.]|uniref:hypothetical protein n=1 Tax=Chelatococcus sp. TaxID=1953771 RepID=UPI001EB5F6EC|nr:hypothetical protein [Chelatococcus sp.]MBX3545581.1 hypothetical protein [Chelatococcus sp.]